MDPQSASFTPREDGWRWQVEMMQVQQVQTEHAERLLRLERRQEEDARMKSVWRSSSPFPSILGGTPQQAPLSQHQTDSFDFFDDQQANLIGSLHLDAEEEPRRTGAISRANSVRFDESANQGHWSHAPQRSVDLIPRTGSGLAHPMIERTSSHKSDGRQSSAGHSFHSMFLGRANSLGIDTTFGLAQSGHSPMEEPPGLTPGLFLLGPLPAILRCWLTRNFKHDTLLYAAVCTGSHASYIASRLLDQLGRSTRFSDKGNGTRKLKLDVYFPEAVARPSPSRFSGVAPQVPSINVEFIVYDNSRAPEEPKAIQIIIGSDALRSHNADVLLSSNTVTLFDDDGTKLSVPLVRPEDDRAFKSLCTFSNGSIEQPATTENDAAQAEFKPFNGLGATIPAAESIHSSPERGATAGPSLESKAPRASVFNTTHSSSAPSRPGTSASTSRLDGALGTTAPSASEQVEEKPHTSSDVQAATSRSGSSPAIWGNWRRDQSSESRTSQLDWASASRINSTPSSSTYQRRDQGIKILKPLRASSRTASSGQQPSMGTPSTAMGLQPQSRFFESGSPRLSSGGSDPAGGDTPQPQQPRGAVSSDSKATTPGASASPKEGSGTAAQGKARAPNPLGGASAFSWMKNEGGGGSGAGASGSTK